MQTAGSREEALAPRTPPPFVGGTRGCFVWGVAAAYGTHAVPVALQTVVPAQGVQDAAPAALTQYTWLSTQAFPQRWVPVRGSEVPTAQTNEHA